VDIFSDKIRHRIPLSVLLFGCYKRLSADIFRDRKQVLEDLSDHRIELETARFGPFVFQVGVDTAAVGTALLRVGDAHARLHTSPLARVADRLEREVVVSSVFGTNSIEGGTLSEEETQLALELDPAAVHDTEQRRAVNIKAAYDLARTAAERPDWQLDLPFVQQIHAAITRDIPHEHNRPGLLRDNPKQILTHVGDQAHGGRYKPPQFGGDIRQLLSTLIDWHQELTARQVPVLIRAPLVHYYYELIHPFWDGNGRVGRVIEASLLLHAGFRYAPFAQARFYLDQIDRYFTLFNTCRKAADKGQAHPNSPFVAFFLEGMLTTLNRLHDRVNQMVHLILFENDVKRLHDAKEINARQYAIVSQVLDAGRPIPLAEMRRAPWYLALYTQRTDKTRQRDLRHLRELKLIQLDEHGRLWPGFAE
jgi:Fic family protein